MPVPSSCHHFIFFSVNELQDHEPKVCFGASSICFNYKLNNYFIVLAEDECTGHKCLHGTCKAIDGRYECCCDDGWTGELCDVGKRL